MPLLGEAFQNNIQDESKRKSKHPQGSFNSPQKHPSKGKGDQRNGEYNIDRATKSMVCFPMDEKTEKNRSSVVDELIKNEKLFMNQMSHICDIMTNGKVHVPVSTAVL